MKNEKMGWRRCCLRRCTLGDTGIVDTAADVLAVVVLPAGPIAGIYLLWCAYLAGEVAEKRHTRRRRDKNALVSFHCCLAACWCRSLAVGLSSR